MTLALYDSWAVHLSRYGRAAMGIFWTFAFTGVLLYSEGVQFIPWWTWLVAIVSILFLFATVWADCKVDD